jgi:hypothetical protein
MINTFSYNQQHETSRLEKVITREEVLTTVDVENVVLWDMTPCSLYHKRNNIPEARSFNGV